MGEVKTKIYDVTNALDEIGVNAEILKTAILEGEIARDSCTANDPPCLPGFIAWGKTVRVLREELVVKGWARDDSKNYSTVVSPDKKIAIAVATGDEGTGHADKIPHTKYPKGSVTQDAVVQNQRSLFTDVEFQPKEINKVTWILLKTRIGEVIYSELSLPAVITKDGTIVSWDKRILLESLTFDSNIEINDDLSDDSDIDIPIMRKVQ